MKDSTNVGMILFWEVFTVIHFVPEDLKPRMGGGEALPYKPIREVPFYRVSFFPVGGALILGHIRDVRPEWVTFPGRKPADGRKVLTKNMRMGHNFDIILPGNGWFSSKLNKTYCSLVNFYCK